jgi:hypothetical protein
MLAVEAEHEAFYLRFPHLRIWQSFYDAFSAPLKLVLIGLERHMKAPVQSETSAE